jgi:tetratricopeptide (TPR) repeat protein
MVKILLRLPDRIIQSSFYLLFFLVPLVLTPFNYELFEYNKMMLTYGLTVIITGSWMIKMVISKEIKIARTPLDLPILLFLFSQIVSTVFSIDRHVSLFGYYSRFNGGLLSTISYVLLYYAFVTNFPKEKIRKFLLFTLSSGLLVSIYGILEHFGIDKDIWVQDVQNRVFSTLGQPNWLAAYLAVLIPITLGIGLTNFTKKSAESNGRSQNAKVKSQNRYLNLKNIGILGYWVMGLLFYSTLLFTKSRSGFLGFWAVFIIMGIMIWITTMSLSHFLTAVKKCDTNFVKEFFLFTCIFLFVAFLFGTPFEQVNRFTFTQLINHQPPTTNHQPAKPSGDSIIDIGITGSSKIREIVWKGSLDVFKNYPLFGSGVETFAFSYYQFRPKEHNMTSEWDFLYNKAHNEYLNYAATTGAFGLGSYLLIILVFVGWNIKNSIRYQVSGIRYKNKEDKNIPNTYYVILNTALFSAWLSILITNFFGFSVVVIQLFFFLIPAISFILAEDLKSLYLYKINNIIMKQFNNETITNRQIVIIFILLFVICYLLFVLARLWYADTLFASGYHASRSSDYTTAYQKLKEAISMNPEEPLYYDELSIPAAYLSIALDDEKESTLSGQLKEEAIIASDIAVSNSWHNVNYWKNQTRLYYALAQLDEKYLLRALNALEKAKLLSPTDPKIGYNLALIYDKMGKKKEAIETLIQATELKTDYRDAYYALAFLYDKNKEKQKAKEALSYILTRLNPNDEEAKKKLEELK